ncbi:MAG: SMC-Scp complex subunit ScpB [Acidimicrobiales bacterium]
MVEVIDEVDRALEAVLMVSTEPVEPRLLAQLVERPAEEIDARCRALAAGYEAEGRGFQLARIAGGWRYQSHPAQAPYIERFVLDDGGARLSAAALETLVIVAYKQPVSRAQVAAIRGVAVDGVMRTLHQRGLIAEVGRDDGPGQAALYGTTGRFLEQLGLDGLDQLPALGGFVPDSAAVESLDAELRGDDPGA